MFVPGAKRPVKIATQEDKDDVLNIKAITFPEMNTMLKSVKDEINDIICAAKKDITDMVDSMPEKMREELREIKRKEYTETMNKLRYVAHVILAGGGIDTLVRLILLALR